MFQKEALALLTFQLYVLSTPCIEGKGSTRVKSQQRKKKNPRAAVTKATRQDITVSFTIPPRPRQD